MRFSPKLPFSKQKPDFNPEFTRRKQVNHSKRKMVQVIENASLVSYEQYQIYISGRSQKRSSHCTPSRSCIDKNVVRWLLIAAQGNEIK